MREQEDRLFPPRPIVAASIAVFRHGKVLLGRRAKSPWRGAFSLPGGVVEVGETLAGAALRELREEVGVEADPVGFVRHVESIRVEDGRVRSHYIIAVFAARWSRGEPVPSEEIDEVAWIDPFTLGERETTPELADILARAVKVLGE